MNNQLGSLRLAAGLTQSDLAALIPGEVDQRTVSKWEQGKSVPKPYQMQFLEDYFNTSKEKIFFAAFNYKMLFSSNSNNNTHAEEVS